MPTAVLSGIVPMLPTPFDDSGRIEWGDFAPVISHQLENGAHGIAALGLGGEASRLSIEERLEVADTVLRAVPRGTRTLIGVSADDTSTACALARHAARHGATAIMVAPPRIATMSRQALRDHYLAVCDAAESIEVMVQDAPAFIDVSLGAEFVAELAAACTNIRYAKSEGFPAADRTEELVTLLGERVSVFGGACGLHYLDVLDAGAAGMIPGCEAPVQFVGIYEAYRAGRRDEAARRFARLQPLLVFEAQTLDIFIASSKAILKSRGIIKSDALRAPTPLSAGSRRVLMRHAEHAGIGA
ncbi:MAG TPA: dihydrodipicolinate synthase family protein [Bryobacteraceae bacterium]|jgi:4-hydroxy-tetrahydrodipicolinate synthase|nr:dihydrodipicolinate synthase family protein [Bryobacteraceae bacterium]